MVHPRNQRNALSTAVGGISDANLFSRRILNMCMHYSPEYRSTQRSSKLIFSYLFHLFLPPDLQPYLCEASYILLEYARTCMFMWMFIEGLYLHNVVTVTVFQGRFPHTLYALVGWGGPVALTAIWAVTTAQYVGQQK